MKEDFINILEMGSERAVADLAVNAIGKNDLYFREVLDLCFLERYPISMRAARVIQLCCSTHPEMLTPFLEEVMEKFMDSRIDGVKRSFLKIFAQYLDFSKLSDHGHLLSFCFETLLNVSETPAVRIYAMDIICKFAAHEPSLRNELKESIEFILDEGQKSLRNRGMKVLAKLLEQEKED